MITTIVYKNGITSNKISSNMSKIDTIITKTITLKVKTLPITQHTSYRLPQAQHRRHAACSYPLAPSLENLVGY